MSTQYKQADEFFHHIVESLPNAILLVDQKGLIRMGDRLAEPLFAYSRKELIGQTIDFLVPQKCRVHHSGHRANFFAPPSTRSMGTGRDLYGLCKDVREAPIEIGLNPIETDEGLQVLASTIDITERK